MKDTNLKLHAEKPYGAPGEIQSPLPRDSFGGCPNLTLPQPKTLMAISGNDHCSMGELGRSTGYHLSGLTGIIDRLMKKNLVQRIRDNTDRRVVKVALTPKEIELSDKIYKVFIEQTSEVIGVIDAQSREKLVLLIEKVASGIKRI
jgi:DNA-binding MarR family transcriptional regulator